MKKCIYILLAVAFLFGVAQVDAYAYSAGNEKHVKEGSPAPGEPLRVYMLVRYPDTNQDNAGLDSGDVVIWDDVSDDGITINVVGRTGVTTSIDSVAGVVITDIPSADHATTAADDWNNRNWGYIQTYGLCRGVNTDTSDIDVGEAIRASATATYATGTTTPSASENASLSGFGYALDTNSSTATQIDVMIVNR